METVGIVFLSIGKLLLALTMIAAVVALVTFLFVGLPVIVVLGILRIFTGWPSRETIKFREQETQVTQQIHHGLSKMEERVEALETVLLDQERKGDKT